MTEASDRPATGHRPADDHPLDRGRRTRPGSGRGAALPVLAAAADEAGSLQGDHRPPTRGVPGAVLGPTPRGDSGRRLHRRLFPTVTTCGRSNVIPANAGSIRCILFSHDAYYMAHRLANSPAHRYSDRSKSRAVHKPCNNPAHNRGRMGDPKATRQPQPLCLPNSSLLRAQQARQTQQREQSSSSSASLRSSQCRMPPALA